MIRSTARPWGARGHSLDIFQSDYRIMVLHRTLIAAAVLAATAPAWASTEEAARAVEEPAQADAAEPAADEGESVIVRDRAGESLTSFTHLTREDISNLNK